MIIALLWFWIVGCGLTHLWGQVHVYDNKPDFQDVLVVLSWPISMPLIVLNAKFNK